MSKQNSITVLPQALRDFSFTRTILKSRHGAIIHKTVHDDLRYLDFVSTKPFICYLIKGRERFIDPDGNQITLVSGDLIAVPKDLCLQSDFVSNDGPLEAILIFYDDRFLRDLAAHHSPITHTKPKAERIPAHRSLTTFMENMVAIYEALSVKSDLAQAKLTELLLLLETLHDGGSLLAVMHDPSENSSRSVRDLMHIYQDQELSTKELAALAGRSIPSFNRDFRRVYGTSPTQWRIQRRLNSARELLEQTDQNVTQIALNIGYEGPSYFIEQFRKYTGKTPTQFRKDVKDGPKPKRSTVCCY